MCLEELKIRIVEFTKGDALKLCRNARNEFSGIEKIKCNDEEEAEQSELSSFYDVVSVSN